MFRIIAALLFGLLIVPGALHFPTLWLMVLAAPAWLVYIFRIEEHRVRARIRREMWDAVDRLPME